MQAWLWRIAAKVLMVVMLAAGASMGAAAQGADDIAALNRQVVQLYVQGKYKEAATAAEKALALVERLLGKEHPDTLSCVNNLAEVYRAQGRYPETEPLVKRVLEARERVLGKEHPDTLVSVNNLATLYDSQGRYPEADPLLRHALEVRERMLGKEHPHTLASMNNLALHYQAQSRYGEAESLLRRALAANERVLGKEHPDTLLGVNNLGALYSAQGRYAEAEPLYRYAFEAYERVLGREHPYTLRSLNNLAFLYYAQIRYAEAELLYRRAFEAYERVLGNEHPQTLTSLNNLAALYQAQRRYAEAEPLLRRVLDVRERVLGREHLDTLQSLNSLAELHRTQGRYTEAEPLHRRALDAYERVLGKEHPRTLTSVNNLALLYQDQGRYAEAEPLLRRALDVRERVLGKEHPDTLGSLNNLAAFNFVQRDWLRAAEFWRRSTAGIANRARRSAQAVTGKKRSEADQLGWQFSILVKAAYRLGQGGPDQDNGSAREMFETAQWTQSSEAAASFVQMAARGARGDARLAALVRERQDLVAEWQKREGLRNDWLGKSPDKHDANAEAENNGRLAAIEVRISDIDKKLAVRFPDYAALASPAPLGAEEVQAQLGANEALVLFLDTPDAKSTPEETFIWVVTKTDIRWARSDFGTTRLARAVQALRCGLDDTAWEDKPCADFTGQSYTDQNRDARKPLPFDHVLAYRLYQALFGQVEDLIKGKQLLIVPSGPLTQLPFQVLVTAAPASGDQRSAAWLIREHALTVLPAVSSLKALRHVARPSTAARPMIGFGNPLLDGDQNHPRFGAYYKKRAELARDKQRCPDTAWQRVAALVGLRRGLAPVPTRGGLADADFLRGQVPLPETADELCAVARDVRADLGGIRLGTRATEREVKRLSETGQLAQYRIVHFATHGALAGQVTGNAEPGLLMTPPDSPGEEDDGYLTASEIAGLKLDADWVILSACNTAAGGAQSAEALSGLARAFIYAQARALLVSHWEVNSDAAVKLITGAIRRLTADKSMGRGEAMRRSMLALIDEGEPREAHPAFWAPFVVVGEGGAAR